MAESLTSIVLSRHLHSVSEATKVTPLKDPKELERFFTVTPLYRKKPSTSLSENGRLKLSLSPMQQIDKVRVVLKVKPHTPSVALPSVTPLLFQHEQRVVSSSRLQTQRVRLRRFAGISGTKSARGGGFSYVTKARSLPGVLRREGISLLRKEFHGQVTGKRLLETALGLSKVPANGGDTDLR